MRVYIAYKYRAIDDKDGLRKDLEAISSAVEGLNHKPFVLGRDVQKWHSSSGSVFKTIPHIIVNIAKSDVLLAYISSEVKSWGLPFELFCAKLFGKPIIIARKNGVSFDLKNLNASKTIDFDNISDLSSKINYLSL